MDFGTGARPRINLPYTAVEKLLLTAAALAALAAWAWLAAAWAGLPGRIAVHFDGAGRPNGWGGRNTLFLAPALSSALCAAMALLSRFPHAYNYAVAITPENAGRQYRNGRGLLLWLNAEMTALFLYLEAGMIRTAQGAAGGLSPWLLPVMLGTMAVTLGWFLYRMAKLR